MRLFFPTQAQAESRSQRALQAARVKEVADAVALEQAKLAEIRAQFQTALASQQARWAEEELAHEQDVERREAEIAGLEEKRIKALKPIDEKEYRELIIAGKRVIEEYERKQDDCDRTQDIFERRLGEVEEQRERNAEVANSLQRRLSGIELQEAETSRRSQSLSEGIEQFRKERVAFDAQCAKQNHYLDDYKRELDARERKLDMRENGLDERENRLIVLEAMYSSPINKSPVRHG